MRKVARSPDDLGHILKQYRLSAELNQSDLAEKIASTQMSISRLESGDVGQKMTQIFKLLSVLNLEIEIRPRQVTSAQDVADLFR